MNKKQDVILKYIREGKSQRQISKETGICRETIRKYIKNYEAKLVTVTDSLDEVGKADIIDDITSKPRYSSSSRSKRALTDDVMEKISQFLKENEQKRRTHTDNEKYTFRCWLLRLGLIGDEFKNCRQHLMKSLDGNSAWITPIIA